MIDLILKGRLHVARHEIVHRQGKETLKKKNVHLNVCQIGRWRVKHKSQCLTQVTLQGAKIIGGEGATQCKAKGQLNVLDAFQSLLRIFKAMPYPVWRCE